MRPLPPTPDFSQIPRSDAGAIRCENCGLLAFFHVPTREYVPAEAQFRQTGVVPKDEQYRKIFGENYSETPVCISGKRDFVHLNSYGHLDQFGWQKLLREDMSDPCGEGSFVKWVPGLGVKEHIEMLNRQYLMERADRLDAEMREREDTRYGEMREREDRRDQRVEEHHQEQMQEQRAEHWREMLILGGAVILAILLAAAIGAGWIPKPPWAGDTANQPVIVVVTAMPERTPITTPIPLSTPSTAGSQPQ